MQIAKWGNSLAVRLPMALVQELGLKTGDEIELRPASASDAAATFTVQRKPGRQELLKRLRPYRGRLPQGYRFDREEANAR